MINFFYIKEVLRPCNTSIDTKLETRKGLNTMYYKVLIFLLFISFVCCENDIQCNQQSKDKMNDYIRKLAVFGDPDRNYPKKDEVQSHCL